MARSHTAPSLSKSALLLSPCIAWAGPQARWYDEDKVEAKDTEKRDKGTLYHKRIDIFAKGDDNGLSPTGFSDVDVLLRHGAKYLDEQLIPRTDQFLSEPAIGINWVTGETKILLDVKDREYPNLKGWQYGTADLVMVLNDGSLLVADWKTGGTDGAEEQLLSLACAFQKAWPNLQVQRKVRISCLQVNEHGVWPHEREVSQEELANHWDAMRFAWEDIGKKYDPKPGIHCVALYCPHLAYCSSITDVVVESAGGQAGREGEPLVKASDLVKGRRLTDTPIDDEEAGFTMAMTSASRRQLDYWTESMKAYIASGGRVIQGQYEWSKGGNGYRWRKINGSN
jgi:hypothetical protein